MKGGAKTPHSPKSASRKKNSPPNEGGTHAKQVKAALKFQEEHMRQQKKLERHNEIRRRASVICLGIDEINKHVAAVKAASEEKRTSLLFKTNNDIAFKNAIFSNMMEVIVYLDDFKKEYCVDFFLQDHMVPFYEQTLLPQVESVIKDFTKMYEIITIIFSNTTKKNFLDILTSNVERIFGTEGANYYHSKRVIGMYTEMYLAHRSSMLISPNSPRRSVRRKCN